MAHSNGRIYIDTSTTPHKGVEIADIQQVLGRGTGDLGQSQTSHIAIDPLRIEYDSTSKGLHITKKDPNDTINYGIYADGFNSAGGAQQNS